MTGRPKHLYSIYQKMIARGRDFSEIYDLVGIRVLVDTVRDCYAALGIIHANWQPVPGRFKDYIAMPKFNMYQSLHTTVIGPNGKPVEMQIRTYAMHRTAEYGIAAHWRYKENKAATIVGPPAHIDEMTWLRQLLDWQREAADPTEFLDALRFDLSTQEVYVFTPKGDVIALPKDSTPVDFAYAVHTEVGHKCIGAKVNGKLVPLESKLSNGDVIEIFTSKSETASPTQDWLGFVQSPRARTKIRQFFNKERREVAIEEGKEAIVKAMRKQGLPLQRMMSSDSLMTIARELHLPDVSALYAAVGENQVSAQSVVTRLVAASAGSRAPPRTWPRPRSRPAGRARPSNAHDPGVVVRGASDVWIKLARCCTPVPGDPIFGFITRNGGVSVHREDCTNADELRSQADRMVLVEWKPTAASMFLVAIQVEALDRHKLLADVTRVLSDERVNILSAIGDHDPGPGGGQPVHVRDGRPEAPGPPADRGPQGRRRLRRLPRHLRHLTLCPPDRRICAHVSRSGALPPQRRAVAGSGRVRGSGGLGGGGGGRAGGRGRRGRRGRRSRGRLRGDRADGHRLEGELVVGVTAAGLGLERAVVTAGRDLLDRCPRPPITRPQSE